MLIDWFTVLAQIVNFLILIYLLKRFLYGPIIRAMEEREKKMAAALDRAENAEKKASQRSQELERERQDLLRSKEKLLTEAKAEVETWRESTLKASKEEIASLRRSWMERLDADRQAFLKALKRRIAEQIIHISDKVLKDLANENLEQQVIRIFLEKVSETKDEFSQKDLSRDVSVQSGLPLSEDQVQEIRKQMEQWFSVTSPIKFHVLPDLGMGIQVIAGDRKVAWNLVEYLENLEKEIMAGLFTDVRVNE